jgi:dihydroorotate dehydrogenase electron transfer subunit
MEKIQGAPEIMTHQDSDRTIREIQAGVAGNRPLGGACFLMELSAPVVAASFLPGQFITMRVRSGHTPLLRRPMSVSRASGNGNIEIIYKVVGEGTEILSNMEPGGRVGIVGPLGNPFVPDGDTEKHVLVAGGIGIGPFPGLVDLLIGSGVDAGGIVLVYGAGTAAELVRREYFEALSIECVYATDDGSLGTKGLVTSVLGKHLGKHLGNGAFVYACGPTPMFRAMQELLDEKGVGHQFSLEAVMACGIGACQSCVVRVRDAAGTERYDRVCMEGPVFHSNNARIVW